MRHKGKKTETRENKFPVLRLKYMEEQMKNFEAQLCFLHMGHIWKLKWTQVVLCYRGFTLTWHISTLTCLYFFIDLTYFLKSRLDFYFFYLDMSFFQLDLTSIIITKYSFFFIITYYWNILWTIICSFF